MQRRGEKYVPDIFHGGEVKRNLWREHKDYRFFWMEFDGDHSTPRNEATNDPKPETESEVPARSEPEMEAEEAQKGRPRHPAKPTTKPSEYVYF